MTLPSPPRGVIRLSDDFWNIRGSFKVGGVVDFGTHVSLVRLASGKFVFLDSYSLSDEVKEFVDAVTDGGRQLEAILNLHPFHTLHVRPMHALYPEAKLYGTARHQERFGDLPWKGPRTEEPALHALYAADLEFSVPRGVDFISGDENVHFSSVLAYHPASKTMHVDDTFLYLRLPKPLRPVKSDVTRLHPTLAKVLERRPGAVADFRAWAEEVIEGWEDAENLCAAHSTVLRGDKNSGATIPARLRSAIENVESKLRAHEKRFG